MNFDPEDARLTAYVLGELDPAERAEVEKMLAEDPAAQAEFAEIQQMTEMLQRELGSAPCPELTPAQRASLRQETAPTPTRVATKASRKTARQDDEDDLSSRGSSWTSRFATTVVTLAACCALATVVLQSLGTKVSQVFSTVNSKLDAAQGSGESTFELSVPASSMPMPPPADMSSAVGTPSADVAVADNSPARNVSHRQRLAASGQPAPVPGQSPDNTVGRQFDAASNDFNVNSVKLPSEAEAKASLAPGQPAPLMPAGFPQRAQTKASASGITEPRANSSIAPEQAISSAGVTTRSATTFAPRDPNAPIVAATTSQPVPFPVVSQGPALATDTLNEVSQYNNNLALGSSPPTKAEQPLSLGRAYGVADKKKVLDDQGIYVENAQHGIALSGYADTSYTYKFPGSPQKLAELSSTLAYQHQKLTEEVKEMQRTSDDARPPEGKDQWRSAYEKRVQQVARVEEQMRQVDELRRKELEAQKETVNTERYKAREENPFFEARTAPLSTFSIDVDTASYANVRRYLTSNQLPPADAVRLEEMVNYFPYDYPGPIGDVPFAANVEIAECPWSPENRLVRFGLKGKIIDEKERPAANLVFLIDVSGSMNEPNKLPLVQASLRLLVRQLQARDRVAIVVYAGNSGLVLESTSCKEKETILSAIDRLSAGGSTNGGAGIQLAYSVAKENFIKGGINRVILATDGDFNVGVSSDEALVALITQKAKSGVFLSVLGFGTGNYQDAKMQQLADKGNGNHSYIDTLQEARKALVDQASGTLVTIAKDVKIQIEFNPEKVAGYRLLGYEKRMLAKEDFNDDTKDAGEIGAGHSVTALYEIVPVGKTIPRTTDPLKYQNQALNTVPNDPAPAPKPANASQELLTLKLRYKKPDAEKSDKVEEIPVIDSGATMGKASTDFKFQAAVAAFSMLLTDSKYRAEDTFNLVLNLAKEGRGTDDDGYRAEFIKLVRTAETLRDSRSESGRQEGRE